MAVGPFIRSAGGKRELAPAILSRMQPDFDTYVEPFLGGGAIFFALWNEGRLGGKTVVLGDGDGDLVTLYEAVRDNVKRLVDQTVTLLDVAAGDEAPRTVYERERSAWNKGHRTPVRHLFLRQLAWNGLWRTNQQGEMNTPWRQEVKPLDYSKLTQASVALSNPKVELLDWDFRRYEEDDDMFIGEGALVYLDPPYLGDSDDFTSYLPGGWGEKDFRDLLGLCATWSERGANVVLSHSDNADTRRLVAELWPAAHLTPVAVRRNINSDGAGRAPVQELIITGSDVAVDMPPVILSQVANGEDARAE